MSDRSPSICRTWVLAAAVIVATGGAASVGRTQQVAGTIGVSLTIRQPVAGVPVRVTGFSVDQNGIARLETTISTSAPTSQIVMARMSTSTTGHTLQSQPTTFVPSSSTELRLRCRVNLGRARSPADAAPVTLRVEVLTVAGT